MARRQYLVPEHSIKLDKFFEKALQLKSEILKKHSRTFIVNIQRLDSMLFLSKGIIATQVHFFDCVDTNIANIIRDYKTKQITPDEVVKRLSFVTQPSSFTIKEKETGKQILDAIDKLLIKLSAGEDLRPAFEAMLMGSIIGIWTAFESALIDTWIDVVNESPKLVSEVYKKKGATKDAPKTISMELIESYGFDLRTKMGTILANNFFTMTKLNELENAYFLIIGKEANKLGSPTIRELNTVRHLLVHKAGKVDLEFQRKTSKIPYWKDVKIESDIQLGGNHFLMYVKAAEEVLSDIMVRLDAEIIKLNGIKPPSQFDILSAYGGGLETLV